MAWKNPKEEMLTEETNSSSINLIGSGTVIKGDVSSDGDLRIDGKVIGTITSKSKVVLGATGTVEGEIKSQNTDIYGYHKGNIQAQDMVFLKSTANLTGDIQTSKIVIESGAIFSGRCTMGNALTAGGLVGSTGSTDGIASNNLPPTGSEHAFGGSEGSTTNEPAKSGGQGFEKIYS